VNAQLENLAQLMPQETAQIVLDKAVAVAESEEAGLGTAFIIGLLLAIYSAPKGMGTARIESVYGEINKLESSSAIFPGSGGGGASASSQEGASIGEGSGLSVIINPPSETVRWHWDHPQAHHQVLYRTDEVYHPAFAAASSRYSFCLLQVFPCLPPLREIRGQLLLTPSR